MATAAVLLRPTPRYAYARHEIDDEAPYSPATFSAYSSRPESPLNLGAESPGSILKPALTPSTSSHSLSSMVNWGSSTSSHVPTRHRLWRSASFQRKKAEQARRSRTPVDVNDCGICFEIAVQPRKMSCCGSVFCLEHISNWIYDPNSDGCCPTCKTPYLTHLPTPPPEYSRYPRHQQDHPADSDSSSSEDDEREHGDSTPPSSADESSPVISPSKSQASLSSTTFEGVDDHTYERIISLIGLTVVMCIIVGWA